VDPVALVKTAASRFVEGAHEPFVECFDPAVQVYGEPAVSGGPVISSRAELEAWLTHARSELSGLDVSVIGVARAGSGAVCEAIVVGGERSPDVWRVALGAAVSDDHICEVRAFWGRAAAVDWLVAFR
jgi:hypothetical protein